MAVISVGRLGRGAIGGGTLAIDSPPNSEDDEDESERRRLAAAAFEFPAKKAPLSFEFTSSGAVELDCGRLPLTGDPPEVKPSSELCRLPPPRGRISEAAVTGANGESERHLSGGSGKDSWIFVRTETSVFYKAFQPRSRTYVFIRFKLCTEFVLRPI